MAKGRVAFGCVESFDGVTNQFIESMPFISIIEVVDGKESVVTFQSNVSFTNAQVAQDFICEVEKVLRGPRNNFQESPDGLVGQVIN